MADPGALGRSLKLADGDLVLTERLVAGDDGPRTVRTLAETDGVANLVQALTVRVLTPLGGDEFNTTYGFDAAAVFAGATTSGTTRDLLQLNLVRTLGTDPRVREIRDVTFLESSPRSLRSWRVAVTVVTADGSRQALTFTLGA